MKIILKFIIFLFALQTNAQEWSPNPATTATNVFRGGNIAIGTTVADTSSKLFVQGNNSVFNTSAFKTFNSAGLTLFDVKNNGSVGIGLPPEEFTSFLLKSNYIANSFNMKSINVKTQLNSTGTLLFKDIFDLRSNGRLGINIIADDYTSVGILSHYLANPFSVKSINVKAQLNDTGTNFKDVFDLRSDGKLGLSTLADSGTSLLIQSPYNTNSSGFKSLNIKSLNASNVAYDIFDLRSNGSLALGDGFSTSTSAGNQVTGITTKLFIKSDNPSVFPSNPPRSILVKDYTNATVFELSGAGFLGLGTNYTANTRLKVATGGVQLMDLAGTGSRMVVADATGKLSTQAIPSSGTATIANNALTLSSANILTSNVNGVASNPINLSSLNTDNQQLTLEGNTLSLTDGGSVTLPTVVGENTTVNNTSTINLNLTGSTITGTLNDDAVTEIKIANDAVTTSKILNSTIKLEDLSATGNKDATTYLAGDNTWKTLPVNSETTTPIINSVVNTLIGNQLTTTVNNVSSTPINLPTSGSAVTVSNVYTIASSFNGTYSGYNYASPSSIYANAIINDSNSNDLTNIINQAYSNGYRKIYFQEGTYLIGQTIVLDNKTDLTIEGAGSATRFKTTGTNNPIFKCLNSHKLTLKNIAIDLKTGNSSGTAGTNINTGIEIGGNLQKSNFENIYFENQNTVNADLQGASPLLIKLGYDSGNQESDFNTFENIRFTRCYGGIVLDVKEGGVFNNNFFNNIRLEHFIIGVDFEPNSNSGGKIDGNIFSNFDVQAYSFSQELNRANRSTNVVRNIRGRNNTFKDFTIADWNPSTSPTSGYIPGTYIFKVTNLARRTTIDNCTVEGYGFNGGNFDTAGNYIDDGTGTQFLNNSSFGGERTSYLMKDVYSVDYRGLADPEKNTSFKVSNMKKMNFSGLTSSVPAVFTVKNFNDITIGQNIANEESVASNLYLKGQNITVNLPTTPSAGQVLSAVDNSGKLEWKTDIDTSIYRNNGNIYGNFVNNTITVDNMTTIHNTRNVVLVDPTVTSSTANNYFTRLRFGTDNAFSSANDILYLYAGRTTNSYNDNRVVIGDNGYLNAKKTENAPYKLLVNGKIKAKDEILVSNTGWVDYVFAKDYSLKPLSEVERFIKENGYLPNMPSAKEIENNGMPLAK